MPPLSYPPKRLRAASLTAKLASEPQGSSVGQDRPRGPLVPAPTTVHFGPSQHLPVQLGLSKTYSLPILFFPSQI